MQDTMMELEVAAPWVLRRGRAPEAITGLWCRATQAGGLMFAWNRPRAVVDGYRIERTRDGRDYELIVETTRETFVLPSVVFNDGWFYRVTAFNARGQGPARWVIFYLRRRHDSILQHVPVRPGLHVSISELVSHQTR